MEGNKGLFYLGTRVIERLFYLNLELWETKGLFYLNLNGR